MQRIVFDLDNTLYSYFKSGMHKGMYHRIGEFISKHMDLTEEEAQALGNEYYKKYGLAVAGFHRHHSDKINHHDYVDYIHDVENMETIMPKDEELQAMLQQFQNEGYDMWIYTNGSTKHARNVLTHLGCLDFFIYRGDDKDDAKSEGVFKCYDYWDQWQMCDKNGFQDLEVKNKPSRPPYDFFEVHAKSLVPEGVFKPATKTWMIEDSLPNLEAPKAMGWGTVFIKHPQPLSYQIHTPQDLTEKPPGVDIMLPSIHTLLPKLKEFEAAQKQ